MKKGLFAGILGFGAVQLVSLAVGAAAVYADPCDDDLAKYCPTYRADDPRRFYCLKGLESQIKPACKSTLRNVTGTEGEFIDECVDDYHKLCGDVPLGRGRVLKCLKENSRALSFECRKKVTVFPDPK